MRAYQFSDDFTAACRKFFGFSLFSVGFFTLSLAFQPVPFFLLLLRLYLGKFFIGISDIDLTDIIEVNIDLLRSFFSYALGFINNNPVDKFGKHQIGDFRGIFVFA